MQKYQNEYLLLKQTLWKYHKDDMVKKRGMFLKGVMYDQMKSMKRSLLNLRRAGWRRAGWTHNSGTDTRYLTIGSDRQINQLVI